jgi:hypothetical protein
MKKILDDKKKEVAMEKIRRNDTIRHLRKRYYLPPYFAISGDPINVEARFWLCDHSPLVEESQIENKRSKVILKEGGALASWLYTRTQLNEGISRIAPLPSWGHAINKAYLPKYFYEDQVFLLPFKELWFNLTFNDFRQPVLLDEFYYPIDLYRYKDYFFNNIFIPEDDLENCLEIFSETFDSFLWMDGYARTFGVS